MSKYSQIFDPYSNKPKENGTLNPNDTLVSTGPNLRHDHGFHEYREVKKGELPHNRSKDFLYSDSEDLWEVRKNDIVPDVLVNDPSYMIQNEHNFSAFRQREADYYNENPIDYSVNEMGFRGPGFFKEGAKHILFLGDSHVSGIGLHYKHCASGYLNDYYTSLGYRFINLGVHGSGIETCYRLLAYYSQLYDIAKVFVFSPHPYRYEFRQPLVVPKGRNTKDFIINDNEERNYGTIGLGNIGWYGMNDFWQRVISDDANTYVKDLRALDAIYGICSIKKADVVWCKYTWPGVDRTYIKPIDHTLDWLRARDMHWDHQMHFYLANKFIHLDVSKEYYNPLNKPAFGDLYAPDSGGDERYYGYTWEDSEKRVWKGPCK